ncbi:type IV pilus twitching motility protein PilT [Opitutales bacterium ASA1]|jgi:twitching motility protein PilT|uniref:type IV pilus twitching motility protein PilT n=1 Tax=Congregicoccus parvus TaxID=3081749 RepID=UPI002B2D8FB5|nr:type IV pilus twitching motility protein PilT [Opitutales bacterium ASA1]
MSAPIIDDLLRLAVENNASDVVCKTDKPALFRLQGRLKPVDMEPLAFETLAGFVENHVPEFLREQMETEGQIDFAYELADLGRFRVNGFKQRGTISIVFRYVKNRIPSFDQLNLQSSTLVRLAQARDGIVLLCGPTGAGKSSTIAAMLDWVNRNQDRHIVTLEDPIEYNFTDEKSVFNQREIGIDVPTFELGLKAVLRQNPDIIFVGEMRDRITFETALSAAETGHLVFSTLHAASVHQAVVRLFEFFPPEQQLQARRQLAGSLRGVIVQRLIPAMEGGGRVPALEILVADSVARNLIQEGKFEKLPALLDAGVESGSLSFNKDLYRLVKSGIVSKVDALKVSPNPQALEMNLKGIFLSEGQRILG